jgi:hypothetical protein
VYDPTDPLGRLLFNLLAMVAEFESDLIRLRTREDMKVAKAKGHLRSKQPKLNQPQEAHLVALFTGRLAGDRSWVVRQIPGRGLSWCAVRSSPSPVHRHQPVSIHVPRRRWRSKLDDVETRVVRLTTTAPVRNIKSDRPRPATAE